MITLKVNNKKHVVPTMDELTVKEFIELNKQDINIINYLSVTLGVNYKEAFNSKVKGIDKLIKRLGVMEDYTKLPKEKNILIDGVLYDFSDAGINTVGQRFMIEENARKLNSEEYLCFIMATAIVDNPMNIDNINNLKDKMLNEPYKHILPTAFFLASRSQIGRRSAMNYLKMLRQWISTIIYESKQGLRSLRHILTTSKFKHCVN